MPFDSVVKVNPPIRTTSRTAGIVGDHSLLGHESYLPDSQVLKVVSEAMNLDPTLLLQFLDQNAHMVPPMYASRFESSELDEDHYGRSTIGMIGGRDKLVRSEVVRIALDQGNHLTAIITPHDLQGPPRPRGIRPVFTKPRAWTGNCPQPLLRTRTC
jgi:hypothetical protein